MLRGPFILWGFNPFRSEQKLVQCLQDNVHFPFEVQQPKVFVVEYYRDTLWKGALLLLLSAVGCGLYFQTEKGDQDYAGFFAFGILTGLWLVLCSASKRRLVINHRRGFYRLYIRERLWHQGPLHQIYVRLTAQQDAYGKSFYSLVVSGYRLEELVLARLSTDYEQQMQALGRRLAHKLYLNYFDCQEASGRHVVRHWPPPLLHDNKACPQDADQTDRHEAEGLPV
ncbi:transmembrane protein 249 [Alligator mississippiensis]|uniref:Transmembrane protein 249 n=1 Tax=Alligator mississippiensis TaxID=8496 RepID=A0A151PCU3_ALLMI|nr:transmembrane protein 249 [Alligator mississippiensis]